MIISISGSIGAGKSTVAKKIAKKLGWPRYYIGGLRREKAKERSMTLAEYNKLGEEDPSTDLEVDKYQEELGKKEDNFIIEGRTSWHFIPHSLKIYLEVEEKEGVKRVWEELKNKENNRNEGKNLDTLEDVIKNIRQRKESDKIRYKKYFDIDVYDKSNYDIVIDTTNLDIEESVQSVYEAIKPYLKKEQVDKS